MNVTAQVVYSSTGYHNVDTYPVAGSKLRGFMKDII